MPKTWKQYPDEHYPRGDRIEGLPRQLHHLIFSFKEAWELDFEPAYNNLKTTIETVEKRAPKYIKSFPSMIASMKDLHWFISAEKEIIFRQMRLVKKEAQIRRGINPENKGESIK